MTDNNEKQHKPALKPQEQHEPELLAEGQNQEKVKTPYLLFALILFGLATMFWKMAVKKDSTPNNSTQQIDSTQRIQDQNLRDLNDLKR